MMKYKDVDRLVDVLQRLTIEVHLFREAYVANNFPNSYEPKTELQTERSVSDESTTNNHDCNNGDGLGSALGKEWRAKR